MGIFDNEDADMVSEKKNNIVQATRENTPVVNMIKDFQESRCLKFLFKLFASSRCNSSLLPKSFNKICTYTISWVSRVGGVR